MGKKIKDVIDDPINLFFILLATLFTVLAVFGFIEMQNVREQQHKDYITVAAMNLTAIKVGQLIDLQKYNVTLESGNPCILQVRTSVDDWWLYHADKNVIWGTSTGNTTTYSPYFYY